MHRTIPPLYHKDDVNTVCFVESQVHIPVVLISL